MPTEYKANATGFAQALADCPTAAFTYDDFSALCKELYKASPPPESAKYPLQHINWTLIAQITSPVPPDSGGDPRPTRGYTHGHHRN